MTAIGTIGGVTPRDLTPAPAVTPVTPVRPTTSSSDDVLAPMRAAMDTVFAVGQPVDKAGAAAILDTGDDFIAGAQEALGNLDRQMDVRRDRLQAGTGSPAQQAEDREQLMLMQVLRDRIQQSLEHTMRLFTDEDDAQLVELQRAELLAPPIAQTAAVTTAAVAAYASGGFASTT